MAQRAAATPKMGNVSSAKATDGLVLGHDARLMSREFEQIGRFVEESCGIRMPPSKRTMVQSRLRRRLNALGIDSFRTYCAFVFGPEGRDERAEMIDALTTNKTLFFREPHHFEHLTGEAVPALARAHGAAVRRPLRVWSAGCSSGEEPYTIAMALRESAAASGEAPFRFTIFATDVSARVLRSAREAVYREDQIEPVPAALRRKYLLRSRDPHKALVRLVPGLRDDVQFRWLNFMDEEWGIERKFHVIFCRNVLIYFDKPTQEAIVARFAQHLEPGGFLYIGHSETLSGMRVPFEVVAPTVYRRLP